MRTRPATWTDRTLGSFAEARGGTAFPIALQGRSAGQLPFYKVSDMNADGNSAWMRRANNYISEAELRELGGRAFDAKTIAFPKVGATIYTNKKRILASKAVVDNNVMGVTVTYSVACLPEFLFYWFHGVDLAELSSPGTVPSITSARVKAQDVLLPPVDEQRQIAAVLSAVQRAIERQERLIALTAELKSALMHKLFTEGTHGEPSKQTGIGPLPQSWNPTVLGTCCDVVSSSMSYTDFLYAEESTENDAVPCMAVKVSDMNLPGNDDMLVTANAMRNLSPAVATRKLVPPKTVVFPKRGAAIATNKKRLTTRWTALDPNLIGVRGKEAVDPQFLFYWTQTFDLRTITDPGPTPQLNKKDLTPIKLPLPPTLEEQRLVAATLDAVHAKWSTQRRTLAGFNGLFRVLLHQLMTAQVRVEELDVSALEVAQQEMTGAA
jgi:type I restriction enzyme, S subunit